LHSEELHDLCSLPNIIGDKIKKKLMGKACGTSGGEEMYLQGFSGKT